ncbi:MAG: hypothetical protein WC059_00185 [Candidatus Paceibacterota bacterium]
MRTLTPIERSLFERAKELKQDLTEDAFVTARDAALMRANPTTQHFGTLNSLLLNSTSPSEMRSLMEQQDVHDNMG